MSKLTLMEKVFSCAQRGEILPIKGHTKIILADPLTGKPKEIVESDNMVTNAVASVLANNYCGTTDFSRTMPLRKLFAGVMLFQNEMAESADGYNVPSDLINPMIAHAGDLANDTESFLRGSPVPSDYEITDTSIKQVFFWPTTHGNGTIRCCCCVPATFGNMGAKPFNDQFSPLSQLGMDTSIPNNMSVSKEDFYKYPISISADGLTGKCLWISGTTFTETTVRHDFTKFGIMRGINDWTKESERTATIRTFNINKTSVFEDDDYYWIYEITSSTSLKIDKVAKSDMTVTQGDVTFSGVAFSTSNIGLSDRPLNIATPRFAYDGTYLYLPNSTGNGFVAVNPNDSSDAFALDGTVNLRLTPEAYGSGHTEGANPVVISSGFIVGQNYLINGNTVYQTKEYQDIQMSSENYDRRIYMDLIRRGASVYGIGHQWWWASYRAGQGSLLLQTFLSTINNVDEVVKTSARTMSVIYTLREAT